MARYIFAGNRFFVLEEMLRLGLEVVSIFAVKDSYLEKELIKRAIAYNYVTTKKELVAELMKLEYDYFISNGLPVILPISQLKEGNNREFINIHPSLLPDLRGMDPVPGALLYGKNSGATCHLMDNGIDTGGIIAQVPIINHGDQDAVLMYQLSFLAEKQAFIEAHGNGFKAQRAQQSNGNEVYYSFKSEDLLIDFQQSDKEILRRVSAFNNTNKLARFIWNDHEYTVKRARSFRKEDMEGLFEQAAEEQVVLQYANNLLIKRARSFLLLEEVAGPADLPEKNTML